MNEARVTVATPADHFNVASLDKTAISIYREQSDGVIRRSDQLWACNTKFVVKVLDGLMID